MAKTGIQEKERPENEKKGLFIRFIRAVEAGGNKLPHPFMLFMWMAIITLVLSFVLSKWGVSVTYTAAGQAGAAAKQATVKVINLLQAGYIQKFLANFVNTYVTFKPLGLIMVMMLGIGYVEETGFFNSLMKKVLLGVPAYMITFVLAMVGVCSNIASDAGIIFATTMGAAVFAGLRRNPILGAVVGYVSGHGGFTANLMIAGTDGLLAGITESAAASIGIQAPIHPLMNWYFMFAATFIIALVVTFVTERIIPKVMNIEAREITEETLLDKAISPEENRGLKIAGWVTLAFIALMLIFTIPQNGLLRNEEGALLPSSPLTNGIVPLLFFLFAAVGTAYGFGSKKITSNRQVPKLLGNGLKGTITFLVISLPACYFISFFNDSKIATVLAVKGAHVLQALPLNSIGLAVCLVLLTGFLNMFMTSGSSKWLILAPVFVPMFSMLNLSPAMTQLAYRIGDSATNPISPINVFIPVLIGLIQQYKKDDGKEVGLGTAISLTMPYSMAILVIMILFMILWMLSGLPIGPGAGIWMN